MTFLRVLVVFAAGWLAVSALAAPDGLSRTVTEQKDSADSLRPRHNPFARPLPTRRVSKTVPAVPSATNAQLRGVLNAGPESFANVNGEIIALGELYGDLRLESVSDAGATFIRSGRSVFLSVTTRSGDASSASAVNSTSGSDKVSGVSSGPESAVAVEEGDQ